MRNFLDNVRNARKKGANEAIAVLFGWVFLGVPAVSAAPLDSSGHLEALSVRVARAAGGLARDRSLDVAASAHLEAVCHHFEAARREVLERRLARQGDSFSRLRPFSAVGGTAAERTRRALEIARESSRADGFTHFGLATDERGTVLLFARRLVAARPFVVRPEEVLLEGRARPETRLKAWLRGPCGPRAPCRALPRSAPLSRDGTHFEVRFPTPAPGRYALELTADVGAGPEVAILRQVRVDGAGLTLSGARRSVGPPTAPRRKADDGRSWLDRLRDAFERAPVAPHPDLERAARAHADAVCAAGWAVHRLPGGLPPEARAEEAGFRGRIREAAAVASTSARARANLESSPAHLAGLLDPTAEFAGVAEVAALPDRVCVVVLLGAPQR